ncbi:MAG TPA: RidA family protein [Gaiellaceae bacterium]|jgi:enamine deaminase RidA (YjgF/YER057c/UK114 family)
MTWSVRHASARPLGEEPAATHSVAAGNVVFVSGCTGSGARVEDQVELALEKARRALEAVGSRMDNVVKSFFLLTELSDYGSVRRSETEFYEQNAPQLVTTPPAATLMVVPSLGRPGVRVQYEVIAALDRDMPGWGVTYFPEHWAGKELAYPHVPKEHAKFARSQSIGNLLVVSGCQALDHETVRVESSDFAEQARIVLDKVKVALEDAGASLAELVKTTVFVKDPHALTAYREVESAFFRAQASDLVAGPPASSAFVVTELPRPEFLIEVEAFAVAKPDVPGWRVRRLPGTAQAAESATAGRLVFLSAVHGVAGDSPIEAELAAALDEVGEALARAGSDVNRMLKITLALRDADVYAQVQSALAAYYRAQAPRLVEAPPATTFMQVPAIVPSGARLQLDVIAVT